MKRYQGRKDGSGSSVYLVLVARIVSTDVATTKRTPLNVCTHTWCASTELLFSLSRILSWRESLQTKLATKSLLCCFQCHLDNGHDSTDSKVN